jgi:hypothetical protein
MYLAAPAQTCTLTGRSLRHHPAQAFSTFRPIIPPPPPGTAAVFIKFLSFHSSNHPSREDRRPSVLQPVGGLLPSVSFFLSDLICLVSLSPHHNQRLGIVSLFISSHLQHTSCLLNRVAPSSSLRLPTSRRTVGLAIPTGQKDQARKLAIPLLCPAASRVFLLRDNSSSITTYERSSVP